MGEEIRWIGADEDIDGVAGDLVARGYARVVSGETDYALLKKAAQPVQPGAWVLTAAWVVLGIVMGWFFFEGVRAYGMTAAGMLQAAFVPAIIYVVVGRLVLGNITLGPPQESPVRRVWLLRRHGDGGSAETDDARAVRLFAAALRRRESRNAAGQALANIGAPAVESLSAALEDEDRHVRIFAAKALGKIGDARAVEPLVARLDDEDGYVRKVGAKALGKIGDARAVEPLVARLDDEDESVRHAVAIALDRLGWEPD